MFMVNVKKQIPNSITLGNLTCGLFAIISIFKFELEMAAFLIKPLKLWPPPPNHGDDTPTLGNQETG